MQIPEGCRRTLAVDGGASAPYWRQSFDFCAVTYAATDNGGSISHRVRRRMAAVF